MKVLEVSDDRNNYKQLLLYPLVPEKLLLLVCRYVLYNLFHKDVVDVIHTADSWSNYL